MAEQELKNLFAKYLDDSISPEEFSRLYELVKTEYNASELDELFRSAFANKEFAQRGNDYDPREVFAEVLSKIEEKEKAENTSPPVIPIGRKNNLVRWVAAASIIFLLGGAYFLFFNKTKPAIAQTQQERFKNDVAPGGNKAILTLGNGKQIILDSAANGELAKQGNAKIIKTDSGKLAYNTTNEKPTEVLYNVLTTPKSGQHQLILSDGSKVWLNAASSIKYPTAFVGNEREVEITGEVYFEVEHNDKMPFKVKAGNQTIEDLGTHFDINAYTDEPEMKITLAEGSIKIASNILKQGQQAHVYQDQIKILSDADVEEAIAWKNGYYKYNSTDIQSLMRQAARWYDVDVVYEGKIPEDKFTGKIPRSVNLTEWLKILEYSEVKFKIDGKKLTVMP
jgi:transmembrane sensor